MRLSDVGQKIAKYILSEIKKKHLVLPNRSLAKLLEQEGGCRVQSIGMAHDDYIQPILSENNIISRKCGTPVVMQLIKLLKIVATFTLLIMQ